MDDNIAGEPLLFSLLDKTPQTDLKIHCQAPSEEVKENWTSQLRSILEMQGDFLRGQYQRPQPVVETTGAVLGRQNTSPNNLPPNMAANDLR